MLNILELEELSQKHALTPEISSNPCHFYLKTNISSLICQKHTYHYSKYKYFDSNFHTQGTNIKHYLLNQA